jgi:hypothetical protein
MTDQSQVIVVEVAEQAPITLTMGDAPGNAGTGAKGDNGWSPVWGLIADSARIVVKVIDWTGGAGTKPDSNVYIGGNGFVSDIASAADIRGPIGLQGTPGTQGIQGLQGLQGLQGIQGLQGLQGLAGGAGTNGWTPILSVVTDGARRVLQIAAWSGGTGAVPSSGLYVGASGLVPDIASAVDVRGAPGADGAGGGGSAASITNAPAGNVVSTDVQSAINELDTKKLMASGAVLAPIGTTQATAAQIVSRVSVCTPTASTAIKLPAAVPGQEFIVYNTATTTNLTVFPATGESIDGAAANAAFNARNTASGKACYIFQCVATGAWKVTRGMTLTSNAPQPLGTAAAGSSSECARDDHVHPFTPGYAPANQTLTLGSQLTLTHGLGAMPTTVLVTLICLTTDLGYAVGTELEIMYPLGTGTMGITVANTSTSIVIRVGSTPMTLLDATGSAVGTLTTASWGIKVRAWK